MYPTLNQEMVREHLELANKHVAEGERRVEAQLARVMKLSREGHDTVQAKALLKQLEDTLALQIETRNRIVQELSESK